MLKKRKTKEIKHNYYLLLGFLKIVFSCLPYVPLIVLGKGVVDSIHIHMYFSVKLNINKT